EVQLWPITRALGVGETNPREICQVPVFTCGHETYWYGVIGLVARALMPVARSFLDERILCARQSPTAMTHEPTRKLQGPHAGKMGGLVLIAFRGHPEVPLLCQVEIRIQCLQTRHERAPQACVVQRYEPILAIAPMLEPTHKDRAVQEIDHRSG